MSDLDKKLEEITDLSIYHNAMLDSVKTAAGLMTGQEWYDKLAEQLKQYAWTTDERDSILQAAFEVSEAAKKAAGIE